MFSSLAHRQCVLHTSDSIRVDGLDEMFCPTMASFKSAGHTGSQCSLLRPQATHHRLSKPRYLVCKTSPPFLQCKLSTIHNSSAKLLTPTDTASCLEEPCLPRANLRGSGTPQSLALRVPRAGGGELRLARSWC